MREPKSLAILECNANVFVHLFHASIVNGVGAIIIIDTDGLIFLCMWIHKFLNVVATTFDSSRSESAGDIQMLANGILRPPPRRHFPND